MPTLFLACGQCIACFSHHCDKIAKRNNQRKEKLVLTRSLSLSWCRRHGEHIHCSGGMQWRLLPLQWIRKQWVEPEVEQYCDLQRPALTAYVHWWDILSQSLHDFLRHHHQLKGKDSKRELRGGISYSNHDNVNTFHLHGLLLNA